MHMTQPSSTQKNQHGILNYPAVSFMKNHIKLIAVVLFCIVAVVGILFYLPIPGLGSGAYMGGSSGYIIPLPPSYDKVENIKTVPVYKITDYVNVNLDRANHENDGRNGIVRSDTPDINAFPNETTMPPLVKVWLAEHQLPVPGDSISPPGAREISPHVSWRGWAMFPDENGNRLYSERAMWYRQYLESKHLVWPSQINAGMWQHAVRDDVTYLWVWVEKVGEVTLISPRDSYQNLIKYNRDIGFIEQIAPNATPWEHAQFNDVTFEYVYDYDAMANGTQQYLIPTWSFNQPSDSRGHPYASVSAVDSDKEYSCGWNLKAFSWNPENHPGFIKNDKFDKFKNTKVNRWIDDQNSPYIPRETFNLMNKTYYT